MYYHHQPFYQHAIYTGKLGVGLKVARYLPILLQLQCFSYNFDNERMYFACSPVARPRLGCILCMVECIQLSTSYKTSLGVHIVHGRMHSIKDLATVC